MAYIEFKDVCKNYGDEEIKTKALKKVSFEINKGELVVITGPSGAGKTTLLNILGGIDNLSSGEVIVNKIDISKLKEKKLTEYRRKNVGFIFQLYNLSENLTAEENVDLVSELTNKKVDSQASLKKVGLTKKKDFFPHELSGGECQKVAIARAISKNPKILLCDEPTGAIDSKGGKQILKLLQKLANKDKMTVVIVTHNTQIASIANKVVQIKNGSITKVKTNRKPKLVGDLEW